MLKKIRDSIIGFTKSNNDSIKLYFFILSAIISGAFPLLHYYNFNFTQVNSLSQILFFLWAYLGFPCSVFLIVYFVLKKSAFLDGYQKYILSILNYSFFVALVIISIYGIEIKILFVATLITTFFGVLLHKYLRKILVFQFLLALLSFIKLIPDFYGYFSYSDTWMEQPDAIENVEFKRKPNIYVIQPDGYANFSELRKTNYNFDNNSFEDFLFQNDFKLYNDFRSNYKSTLSSNSSMFTMKHHYYYKPKLIEYGELYNARDVIVGDNPVISTFKKNGYKTFLIIEKPYLIINRPKMMYDYCNYKYEELSYTDRGFQMNKEIFGELKNVIQENRETENFYFIEKMSPNHISNTKNSSRGKELERLNYLEKLKDCNIWLRKTLSMIIENDPNSMIVIVGDHGGYVGLDYSFQSLEKQNEESLVKSIFTTALAIKWPGKVPKFDNELKTNVNLFRVLFSYLGENQAYLRYLQKDNSYGIIKEGAPNGVYELINDEGEVVFNKLSK